MAHDDDLERRPDEPSPVSADDVVTTPRAGSGQDLARRMDTIEKSHSDLARDVTALAGVVARVELNQAHASELNKLRFDSLDTSISGVSATLDRFMNRINAIVSGEVRLPQAVQGEELVRDYLAWRKTIDASIGDVAKPDWRKEVDGRLDAQDIRNARLDLIGRIAVLLLTSNLLAILAGAYAIVSMHH